MRECYLINQSISQSVTQSVNQSVNLAVISQLISQSVSWLVPVVVVRGFEPSPPSAAPVLL